MVEILMKQKLIKMLFIIENVWSHGKDYILRLMEMFTSAHHQEIEEVAGNIKKEKKCLKFGMVKFYQKFRRRVNSNKSTRSM